jgi:pullulanase/glycogen debranching enzyme
MESTYSHLQLGCIINSQSTSFRLFFPNAERVKCVIYDSFDDQDPDEYIMRTEDGEIWRLTIEKNLTGKWYQYKVQYKSGKKPNTPYADLPFADPYSHHVTSKNTYRLEAKTYIFKSEYDWEDDTFIQVDDPRDLIIYETHVKDLVTDTSSKATGDSIYKKWLDLDQVGGIPHLKRLGVNAVEFLPLHKFPTYEPPYGEKTKEGHLNTWNPYSRNYWGYMTSFFLAPETIYASDGHIEPGKINGQNAYASNEFKSVVKALHNNGIAVIMDVVFNHTSIFDINALCHHMPDIFLRHDEKGKLMNRSGTGNEMNTEHPIVRKLIIDSIRYWMEEYHIDGFRFDLAGLLDEKSWDSIRETAKSINPDAVIIAEPWGGRYVPYLFSNHNWSSWNDRFRNGIKGSDPLHDRGFIFSDWQNGMDRKQLENLFQGTVRDYAGGLFKTSAHSVNYLESHDGYTLGDFIRIGARYDGENPVVENKEVHTALSQEEMRIAKLGAFCLMVSPGLVMIHAGQEFARSKVIPKDEINDSEAGRMDYDSYNKDNETNWINFRDIEANRKLLNYYIGLIKIRKGSPALSKSEHDSIHFEYYSDPLHICFYINGEASGDIYDYYVAINVTYINGMHINLPHGTWEVLVSNGFASLSPIDLVKDSVTVQPRTAMLMRKLRH